MFLKPLLAEIAGNHVVLIETGAAVARRLAQVLEERGLRADAAAKARERYWTSGDVVTSSRVISKLLGRAVEVEELPEL